MYKHNKDKNEIAFIKSIKLPMFTLPKAIIKYPLILWALYTGHLHINHGDCFSGSSTSL